MLAFLIACFAPTTTEAPPVDIQPSTEVPLPVSGLVTDLIPTEDGCAVATDQNEFILATPDGNSMALTAAPEAVAFGSSLFGYDIAAENANGNGLYVVDGESEVPPFECRTDQIFGIAQTATNDTSVRQIVTNVQGYYKEQQIIFTAWGNAEIDAQFWDCLPIDYSDSQILLPLKAYDESAYCLVAKDFGGTEETKVLFYE